MYSAGPSYLSQDIWGQLGLLEELDSYFASDHAEAISVCLLEELRVDALLVWRQIEDLRIFGCQLLGLLRKLKARLVLTPGGIRHCGQRCNVKAETRQKQQRKPARY